MPQLGVRKQKQHSPEAKPLPPPVMGNIPLTCQGHSECSWLPLSPRLVPMPTDSSVIRTVYNRHLKGRKTLALETKASLERIKERAWDWECPVSPPPTPAARECWEKRKDGVCRQPRPSRIGEERWLRLLKGLFSVFHSTRRDISSIWKCLSYDSCLKTSGSWMHSDNL